MVQQAEEPFEPGAGKVKILLVDDTPENLISLEAALSPLNEEIVTASSGKEALRYLLEEDFAVILLDVKMPEMDGLETAEFIRGRPRSQHTPILFLTGYRNEEQLLRGYMLGAVDFLFKPILPEVLRSKVAVFVQLSRNAELLRAQAEKLQKQAEHQRKLELRFRSLLEAAPDAMVISRDSGEIVLVNSRTETLFGLNRDELLGQNVRMLVPGWDYAGFSVADEDSDSDTSGTQPAASSQELQGVNKEGISFPAEITSSPLQTDEGMLIISAVRDITERKIAEQELRRAAEQVRTLNADLEKRVLERTQELLMSNEELAQFAYVASHDLQEPLRTLTLYTQLLARRYGQRMDDDAERFISYIVEGADRMSSLIRDLLEHCRTEPRGSNSFAILSCDSAVRQAIDNLRSPIIESGASVEVQCLPKVLGDQIQITRLFQNLLSNSLKYRSSETPRICVWAEESEREWIISVRDNGIGIDPQYAEKVFGIFKRLHSRQSHPGNGIGLAICKKIVTRHGGRIWVESQVEEGATFKFTLPKVSA